MADCCMTFSDDWREFLKEYSFKDEDEVYTNGSQLIQVFRVEQLIEHLIAQELLKEQEPTVSGWVSVKDRLPDESGSYLVMLENVFVTYLAMNVHYWNAKDEYWKGSEAHSRIVGISHWMPLPEPPKEDEE